MNPKVDPQQVRTAIGRHAAAHSPGIVSADTFSAADFTAYVRAANCETVRAVKAAAFGQRRSEVAANKRERAALARLFKLVFGRKPTEAELEAMIP